MSETEKTIDTISKQDLDLVPENRVSDAQKYIIQLLEKIESNTRKI